MTQLPLFQYFGSRNSQDIDVVFFVEKMPPTVADCAQLCATFGKILHTQYAHKKPINSNVAIVEKGVVRDTFKGCIDEVNNALYHTFHLHPQVHEKIVTDLLPRDIDLKFLRSTRSILSHLTKSQFRTDVKLALKSDIHFKYKTLINIDLNIIDWQNAKMDVVEIKKALAFQMGQAMALFAGEEAFTKDAIGLIFPILQPYLNREPNTNFDNLQSVLCHFLDNLYSLLPTIKSGFEYKYAKITNNA
jgi:hypothetical protein